MSRVVHFEIHADDLERAKSFYAHVFGWRFEDYGAVAGAPYWGVITGPDEEPGINGGLLQRPLPAAGSAHGVTAYVCTVGVADFDQTAERIAAAGGRVAQPKMALTGMAWQGYFLDTEGNIFGIHQPDPPRGPGRGAGLGVERPMRPLKVRIVTTGDSRVRSVRHGQAVSVQRTGCTEDKGNPMKKTLKATGLTTLSALLLTALPLTVGTASAATATPQSVTAPAAAGPATAQFAHPVESNLTFVGGRFEDLTELHAINDTAFGTSKSPSQFTQDDGWNQQWQEWTPGNELKFGWDLGEEEFTISDLTFEGGRAKGTMFGPHRDMWGPGLERVNLGGDRYGTPAAKVTVDGTDVVISGETQSGERFVLEFTLLSSSNRPLG